MSTILDGEGVATGEDGAEKGSLEPKCEVSAGYYGKGKIPQRRAGVGASKAGKACWSQIPQDLNTITYIQCRPPFMTSELLGGSRYSLYPCALVIAPDIPSLETSIWIWGQTVNSLIKTVHQTGRSF